MRDPRYLRFTFWLGLVLAGTGLVWTFTPPPDADTAYNAWVQRPGYGRRGPRILIDEAHRNSHTARDHYGPLAKLLARDGYQVSRGRQTLLPELLEPFQVLVIANPRAGFDTREIAAIRNWVQGGGGLLLVADRHPSIGAARPLAGEFGAVIGDSIEPAAVELAAPDHPARVGREKYDAPVQHLILFPGPALSAGPKSTEIAVSRAAAIESGGGRVMVLTDAEALSARRVNGERLGINTPGAGNAQLALNIAHWLSRLI